MRKLSSEKLRTKLAKIYKIEEKRGPEFENLRFEIETELNKRNFAAIYHAACRHLKLKRINNQFEAASIYADAVINGYDYAPTDTSHEIRGFDTKNGVPCTVYFQPAKTYCNAINLGLYIYI